MSLAQLKGTPQSVDVHLLPLTEHGDIGGRGIQEERGNETLQREQSKGRKGPEGLRYEINGVPEKPTLCMG
jgi:hypothetical protein